MHCVVDVDDDADEDDEEEDGDEDDEHDDDNDEKHGDGADSREGEFLLITICVLRRVCQENCPSILLLSYILLYSIQLGL